MKKKMYICTMDEPMTEKIFSLEETSKIKN